MILVGIDVAKDKHDCFVMNSEGEVLLKPFTVLNNMQGFNELYQKISSTCNDFDKVKQRAKPKQSISRLVTILFPELEKLVSTLHMVSVYALLSEFSSAKVIASAHLTKLTNILFKASKGRYTRETAIMFREAARNSMGSHMPVKSLELKHTIELIKKLDNEIEEIEKEIKRIMNKIDLPILSIHGIGLAMGAIIIAEVGDFSNFSSPDKVLVYAGLSPSTYQSGNLYSTYAKMEKRGLRYVRYPDTDVNLEKENRYWSGRGNIEEFNEKLVSKLFG